MSDSQISLPIRTGHETYVDVSRRWSGPALLVMRLLIGWHFFLAGMHKVLTPGGWSAKGFLLHAVRPANPFAGFFEAMANSSLLPIIDVMNMAGLTLIGLALIFGALVRFSAFWGAIMMWFYWMAALPLSNSVFVNEHVIYIALLFFLGAFGAGRYYGIDKYVEEMEFVRDRPWLRYVLG